VTVRFETADTPPGPVRTFSVDDRDLSVYQFPDDPSDGSAADMRDGPEVTEATG
jgi:DNA polymerase IV